MSAEITFFKAIQNMILWFMARRVETATVGVIESYDPKTGKARVTPLINNNTEDDTGIEYQPIVDVPVCMMKTKKARVTIPVEQGDTVLLITAKRSLATWLYSGKKGNPEEKSLFDLNNVIAIPCVNPFNFNDAAGEATNDLQAVYEDMSLTMGAGGSILIENGQCSVEITSGKVSINGENLTVDV